MPPVPHPSAAGGGRRGLSAFVLPALLVGAASVEAACFTDYDGPSASPRRVSGYGLSVADLKTARVLPRDQSMTPAADSVHAGSAYSSLVYMFGAWVLTDAPGWEAGYHDLCWLSQFVSEMFPQPRDAARAAIQEGILRSSFLFGGASDAYIVKGAHPEGYGWWNVVYDQTPAEADSRESFNMGLCDTINFGIWPAGNDQGSICEIVEHVLHMYAIGLAYQFPDEWGWLNPHSTILEQVEYAQTAVPPLYGEHYDEPYAEVKEFAFSQLLLYWDQGALCCGFEHCQPSSNAPQNKAELQTKLPETYAMIESTLGAPEEVRRSSFFLSQFPLGIAKDPVGET